MYLDINEIKLDIQSIPPVRSKRGKPRHRSNQRFLKGPIPWNWIVMASRLPGKTLHVGIALWFIAGLKKDKVVKMQKKIREEMGISRQAYHAALEHLEASGLISVQRKPGATPIIELCNP